jgi:serine acetyltransferase
LSNLATRFNPVMIGKGVWIGANVTVLPGVDIGDFAIIGAGSVPVAWWSKAFHHAPWQWESLPRSSRRLTR